MMHEATCCFFLQKEKQICICVSTACEELVKLQSLQYIQYNKLSLFKTWRNCLSQYESRYSGHKKGGLDGGGGVPNSVFNKKWRAYSWFDKWNITLIQYILAFLLNSVFDSSYYSLIVKKWSSNSLFNSKYGPQFAIRLTPIQAPKKDIFIELSPVHTEKRIMLIYM